MRQIGKSLASTPGLRVIAQFFYRTHPKNQVDPVLVTKAEAARLLSVSDETLDRLIQQGDLRTKVAGIDSMIPHRSLLVFAGVARWRFQEIEEV